MRECRRTDLSFNPTLIGERVVVCSTTGARRNAKAVDRVGGVLRTVDFSPMELRVLDLVSLGKTTNEIATALRIRERTVELHVRHSLKCLRARSREELLSLTRRYH